MNQIRLDADSIVEMKAFYQEELNKTLRRLEHINKVMEQLGESGTVLEISVSTSKSPNSTKAKSLSSSPKRKYRKKRGPKSKWDKAILKTIAQAGKPLTYDELTNFLMISEGREPSKLKNTKATVQNTVFRLRNEKKIDTYSTGSRIKFIAPIEWFDNGTIKESFASKASTIKKKAKPVSKGPKRKPGRPRKTSVSEKIASPAAETNISEPTPKLTKKRGRKPLAKKVSGIVKATPKKKSPKVKTSSSKPAKKVTAKKKPVAKKAAVKKTPVKKVPAKAGKAKAVKTTSSPAKKASPKKAGTRKVAMKKTVKSKKK